jgi:molecular chaperone Hsp33
MPDSADRLVRCFARRAGDSKPNLRLLVADTTDLTRQAAEIHALSPLGTLAFARALTGGVLLGGLAKNERNINLQLAGDGPLGTVFVDSDPAGTVRGYVSKNPGLAPVMTARPSVRHGFGAQGFVNVLRADAEGRYFRGTVQIKGGEVDDDLSEYLLMSEQVESVLLLDALQDDVGRITKAVGVLIQTLPSSGEPVSLAEDRERMADGKLYAALKTHGEGWLEVLLEALRIEERTELTEQPVGWFCQCTDTRVRAGLMAVGVDELSDMIAKEGHAEIHCDFCRKRYFFDRDALAHLRDLAVGAALAHKDKNDEGNN